jgi:tetratricopeptide (TPR) repeat protein
MPSRLARVFAALLFLLSVPLILVADDEPWSGAPFQADPKALLAAAEKVSSDDSAAVVLLDEARYTFDAQGRSTSTHRILFRIVADSAVEGWSTIEAPWAPWYQERPQIEARVVARDGTVHQLDPKAISERPVEEDLEIFSDNRIVRGPLPGIATGSVVEEVITYKDKNPMFDAGTTDRFSFGRFVPIHQARLVLEAPSSLALRVVNKSDIKEVREEKDGQQRIVFESGPMKAVESFEWNLPFDTSILPYVGFSTGKSWQELARRYSEIVDKQIAAAKGMKLPVAASATRLQTITNILAEIQKNIRYAGVEIGESSIVPRTPSEVLANKYGDCKDKATLLVALLRQAGLPANVVLLRAGENLDVAADLPGMGQFNHAIVLVDGDPPIWVDPTDEFARAGELPMMDQGRLVLIANPKTTALVTTPVAESAANHTVETRTFNLSEEGKANVVETTEATGSSDSSLRRYYVTSDRKKYREQIENYAKQEYAAKSLKNLEATDGHDLSKPFRLTLEVAEAARGTTGDGEADVAIFVAQVLDNVPYSLHSYEDKPEDEKEASTSSARNKKRVHDFVFPQPNVKEWHYRLVAPVGYAPRTLPANETLKLGTATLTKEFAVASDGAVVATFKFDTGKRRLTAAEYEEMRKAIHDVDESKALIIGFDEIGQARLNAGDVAGALAEFRKLASLHPKEARHHAEIARALLAGGMGDASRDEIRRAIAIEPTYAGAQQTLGLILEHDTLGRPFRKGFDLKGAIEAYRKARALDPKSIEVRSELAKLLEYGEDGTIFGRNARVNEAVDEYKAIQTDLKDKRLDGEYLIALAHAGRFKELRDFGNSTKDPEQRDLATIISDAALDGSDSAIKKAGTLDPTTRKARLGAAAQRLIQLRLYRQAADLMEQATQGTPKANEARAFIDVIRKAIPIEQIAIPENEPKSAVMRMNFDLARKAPDELDPASYFTSDEIALLKENRKELDAMSAASLRIASDHASLPLLILSDLGFAAVQFQQEGDEKSGYRLRLRFPAGMEMPKETFYVIRDHGKYVISASESEPALIGWSALRFADAGDVESARKWLNWAREGVVAGNSDDPLSGSPFAAVWPKEKATATADEVRLAAATLMLNKAVSKKSEEILLAAREKATGDEAKSRIDHALLGVYYVRSDWANAATVAQRLYDGHKDSDIAFNTLVSALSQGGRLTEADKIANERLTRRPKDADALRALGSVAMRAGDYTSSEKYYRRVIDEMSPTPEDYNNVAWNALFSGKSLDKALEDAQRATSPNGSPAAQHTLAAILAENGKNLEARDALLKSMDEAGVEEPASHDWYVLGRIAENYGARDAALAAYKRVDKPEGTTNVNDSTYLLAQRRIKAMGK